MPSFPVAGPDFVRGPEAKAMQKAKWAAAIVVQVIVEFLASFACWVELRNLVRLNLLPIRLAASLSGGQKELDAIGRVSVCYQLVIRFGCNIVKIANCTRPFGIAAQLPMHPNGLRRRLPQSNLEKADPVAPEIPICRPRCNLTKLDPRLRAFHSCFLASTFANPDPSLSLCRVLRRDSRLFQTSTLGPIALPPSCCGFILPVALFAHQTSRLRAHLHVAHALIHTTLV